MAEKRELVYIQRTQKKEDRIEQEKIKYAYLIDNKRPWAKRYDKCIGCGLVVRPHWAQGYCTKCYPKHILRKTGSFNRKDPIFYGEFMKSIKSKISATNKIKRNAPAKIIDILSKESLTELYYKQKMSCQDIASKYNCSRVYIYNLCLRYGIRIKTKSESMTDRKSKGKMVRYHKANEHFFKHWSNEMAYVLGFIYTDGHMDGRCSQFTIAQKEIEILEKIKKIMQAEQEIRKYKHQDIHYLCVVNAEMIKDLLKLGLTPAKSLTIRFPQIPNECVGSFIRGIFDGDGTIYHERGNIWRAKFVSGSKDFIYGLKNKLDTLSGISDQPVHTGHTQLGKNFYQIGYQSKADILKLFEFMYDKHSIDNGIYLTRKYLKFKEAITRFYGIENNGPVNNELPCVEA